MEFKRLKDVCQDFEQELRQISNGLFSAKLEESFDDVVQKKTRDLSLFTAKSRLLGAIPLSLQPEITSQEKDEETTMINYGEAVTQKLIEHHVVKSAAQSNAVKNLLTTPDDKLDPKILERKRKILTTLGEYTALEARLLSLQAVQREREDTLAEVRERWHAQLGQMRDLRELATGKDAISTEGPYYQKLLHAMSRMEQLRWLVPKLVSARSRLGTYDWLRDPDHRLQALKMARQPCGIDSFVD